MRKLWRMEISNKIKKSINAKLSLWIVGSLIISVVFGMTLVQVFRTTHFLEVKHVDYDKDRNDTVVEVLNFINGLYKQENDKGEYIRKNIASFKESCHIHIVNKDGDVEYHSANDDAVHINIDGYIKDTTKAGDKFINILYPLSIDNNIHYFVLTKAVEGVPIYTHEISYVVAATLALILFIFLIYFGFRKKIKYIEYISSSIEEIAKGNLDYKLEIKGEDELSFVANQINLMEKSILNMIEKERQSERTQRELITNISHDLKTPLTIILGYLDIIRTKACKGKEEEEKYIEIAYEKALLLQKMVLKLFEFVNISHKEIILNKSDVNINKLLGQVITDHLAVADGKNISIEYKNPQSTITLSVDLDKICRVFNNLISNAIKYSEENEKITVTLGEDTAGAVISFRNKCRNINEEDLDKLFIRFYRGDKARNSSVEGSGIGLSIVKKIIELHNSHIWVEQHDDEIWFIIRLRG
ncbi:sensor histidine kinase [Clostridium beijerinckii]|uniref:histidine kinase n=1 Tax=Clostridium beijerinckii TaxID=1520 RepID=A0AAX0B393_CLOBE|nr:HAMP domain-containing sensor histidine kinase [Clostridium beijerinckii]NRT33013.1 signal transduction histidine kinase [Clostridium beijerinckii]NRT47562.1 signal transduction histidine kinase [Clostridium beijerinckii]NRT75303.1 signal transduction histidine kinase [Clostridium beijerinckii]NRT89683.1 signal transduction histidine kinase [Clostridium beijerinckii]NRZ24148.1 signal transduction histidine kinase [Clostridium beijerinckii]